MGDRTSIEWVVRLAEVLGAVPATWNVIDGCSRASEGCRHCYAAVIAHRYGAKGNGVWAGLTERDGQGAPRFNGTLRFVESRLAVPLRKRGPRVCFAGSTTDLFHERVEDAWLDRIFAVMALRPDHLFLLLTKRPERMRAYLGDPERRSRIADEAGRMMADGDGALHAVGNGPWPLPNVWLGTSVEDQAAADARIPHLLATSAVKRFVSCEPLLGVVDLTRVLLGESQAKFYAHPEITKARFTVNALVGAQSFGWRGLDWVIVGGESGPGARPMHPEWARSLRDQCEAASVPFFFKQWGEWSRHGDLGHKLNGEPCRIPAGAVWSDGRVRHDFGDGTSAARVGKKTAGSLLDGALHIAVPEVV